MGKVEQKAARLNLWTALIERGGSLLIVLGGWQYVAPLGTALVSGWALAVHYVDRTPFWGSCIAGLILCACTFNVIVAVRRAWSIRGIKKLDLSILANDLKKFREDAFEFLLMHQEVLHASLPGENIEISELSRDRAWELRRDFSQKTSALAAQRFAHRAMALIHLLAQADIPPPSLWAFDHELPNIAAYFGAVGELLERGLLEEARSMTHPRENRMHLYLG